ncbi:endolytic transglycosylase MltG [Spirillospora sp. NPDC047279]|uniref:endolytic transglycosylase MltG n=1 Tax=Spirillospora sp. NPDC047279 TaxID=3155478 RepID=UPI0033CAA8FA
MGSLERRDLTWPLAVGAVLLLVLAGCGLAFGGMVKSALAPDDFEGRGQGEAMVRIEPGQSAREVGTALEEKGVVASDDAFIKAVEGSARAAALRPGLYRLRREMKAADALGLLFDPAARVQRKVTVREGLRLDETLTVLARGSGIPRAEFAKAAADPSDLGLPSYADGRLEGFLFPATYPIEPGQDAKAVLAAMVRRFRQAAADLDLESRAEAVRLTPLQAVTMGSIAQAEGGTAADYPKISRVVYNRLESGGRLQLDTTVLYAQRRHDLRVSESDTRVDSPYNTYTNDGLPPGPISNPGEAALKGALNPARGDWTFFVTTDPKNRVTRYTASESEFVRFREELNRALDAMRDQPFPTRRP